MPKASRWKTSRPHWQPPAPAGGRVQSVRREQPGPTRPESWRIAGEVGGQLETVPTGQAGSRIIAGQRYSADVRLGIKWSQVSNPVSPTEAIAGGRRFRDIRLMRPTAL